MNDFSENQNALFENFGIAPYEEQMLRSDEKFSIWKSKTFSERQSIFKKVSTLSRYSEDLLSNWVSEQMDILLAKSVMG
ncbi:hypothetical protein AQ505_12575 [Pedobacter sp. PACM 27299]|uniref:hypothetical protein n=1 Tax=Pedobacter sp. PACM 27299 TaxID=1727164 RepID=UPI000705C8FA|nr:hypothetical protein [Pedobacter sp. PACM 27299]ALL06253.1 hypothetical protein AQ505_12575 [Pedobacter sp. PACM 27299]